MNKVNSLRKPQEYQIYAHPQVTAWKIHLHNRSNTVVNGSKWRVVCILSPRMENRAFHSIIVPSDARLYLYDILRPRVLASVGVSASAI